jgi:FAD synthase
MTRRRLMALAKQLQRIEALAHDLALEIQRDSAIDSQTTRETVKRIWADAVSIHAVVCGNRQR